MNGVVIISGDARKKDDESGCGGKCYKRGERIAGERNRLKRRINQKKEQKIEIAGEKNH